MANFYPIELYPMTTHYINDVTHKVESESRSTWMIFPEEIEHRLSNIIIPYVDTSQNDAKDLARWMLAKIEMSCRRQFGRIPWAIVFFPEEYPVSGHLLSFRTSQEDIRFSAYSTMQMQRYDHNVLGAPPLSIFWFFSKEALIKNAEKKSPILVGIYEVLKDADENGCWTMIADPLDSEWVSDAEKTNNALFLKLVG